MGKIMIDRERKEIEISDDNIPDKDANEMLVRKLMNTSDDDLQNILRKMENQFPGITKEYLEAANEYDKIENYKTINDKLRGSSLRGMKESGFLYKNAYLPAEKPAEINMGFMEKNEILKLVKLRPYDLLVKSAFGGVPLGRFIYHTDKNEIKLVIRLLNNPKFKNVKIDENLINLLMHTDNDITIKRNLFYPAFFIDTDFEFSERFIVKGILVFECFSVKVGNKTVEVEVKDGKVNDTRIHFVLIDKEKRDTTCFGISFAEIYEGLNFADNILPEYIEDADEITKIMGNTARIVCNVIDMVEGNKDELETRLIVPPIHQNEKRLKKGRVPITTTVVIKPKKELLAYTFAFQKEHRKVKYSHKFVVRGHFRHLASDFYKEMQGKKIWIKPFIKGKGLFVKKDALFTE